MNEKKYFPGLDALRFFTALGIIIHHIEQLKSLFKIPSLWESLLIKELGRKGIMFFLVLSGFLVTYKFFREVEKNGEINIKKFYSNRRLRIWPIYLLIIIWSFFIFPHLLPLNILSMSLENQFLLKLAGFSFMLPNLILILFPPVWGLSQAWVIGVEEQFYLFWPKLVEKFKSHFIFLSFLLLMLKYGVNQVVRSLPQQVPLVSFLAKFLYGEAGFYFEYIVVGGIGAYFFAYNKEFILKIIYSKFIQVASVLFLLLYMTSYKTYLFYLPLYHRVYEPLIYFGIPFSAVFIILNVGTNSNSLITPYGKFINSLGKISYGVYMYHVTIIFFVLHILNPLGLRKNLILLNLLLYFVSMVFTILVSKISSRYFESFFLKRKI